MQRANNESEILLDEVYASYCRFVLENGLDIQALLAIHGTPKELERFKEFHGPLPKHEFIQRVQRMTAEQRVKFCRRMRDGYEVAKRTWAADAANNVLRNVA
jgi:hypothetical protein